MQLWRLHIVSGTDGSLQNPWTHHHMFETIWNERVEKLLEKSVCVCVCGILLFHMTFFWFWQRSQQNIVLLVLSLFKKSYLTEDADKRRVYLVFEKRLSQVEISPILQGEIRVYILKMWELEVRKLSSSLLKFEALFEAHWAVFDSACM